MTDPRPDPAVGTVGFQDSQPGEPFVAVETIQSGEPMLFLLRDRQALPTRILLARCTVSDAYFCSAPRLINKGDQVWLPTFRLSDV